MSAFFSMRVCLLFFSFIVVHVLTFSNSCCFFYKVICFSDSLIFLILTLFIKMLPLLGFDVLRLPEIPSLFYRQSVPIFLDFLHWYQVCQLTHLHNIFELLWSAYKVQVFFGPFQGLQIHCIKDHIAHHSNTMQS